MRLHKVTFALRSAVVGSPLEAWQADTVFGQLCWALARREGPEVLAVFLGGYGRAQPPLVISNGFPNDLLPRPILPPPVSMGSLRERRVAALQSKQAGAVDLLTLAEFNRAIAGERFNPDPKDVGQVRVTLKNQINRATSTTGGEGNLYSLEEGVVPRGDDEMARVSVYAWIAEGQLETVWRMFAGLAEDGYGKRKSVGYGEIESWDMSPFSGFSPPPRPEGFIALSNFVPAPGDPTDACYRLSVKYGKLGEEFANLPNPFKKPLVMLAAGSCFRAANVRPYYGRLVPGISPAHSAVVQYGLALAVPMKFPQDLAQRSPGGSR